MQAASKALLEAEDPAEKILEKNGEKSPEKLSGRVAARMPEEKGAVRKLLRSMDYRKAEQVQA